MTKKSFKGSNPALQYISSIEPESTDNEHITDNTYETDNKQETGNTQETHNTEKAYNTQEAHSTQETVNTDITDSAHYTDNTLNMSNTHNAYNTQEQYNEYNKHNDHNAHIAYNRETKSRRLNLLLQPSLLENMTKIARMRQTSVNDLVNTVLRSYIEQEAAVVERYEEVFGEDAARGSRNKS